MSDEPRVNETRLERGHRLFAALYPRIVAREERTRWSSVRPRIMGEAHGRVIDVGTGAGTSLPYYPSDAQVTAIEPDPHMLKQAERLVAAEGLSNVSLRHAPAERLPFDGSSFDHVVFSWVLCTVDDLPGTLAEARRVLKPDGTLRFMEHVRNDNSAVWRMLQAVIAPPWHWFGAGCRLNQQTGQAIEDAGFSFDWIEREPGWLQPVIYGTARARKV